MPKTNVDDVETETAPSRRISEVASAAVMDTEETTLRVVELEPADETGDRHPHAHEHMEELLYILEGEGKTWIEGETFEVGPGDTVFYPPGERHMTVNTGDEPLTLLAFFPHPDIEQDFVLDEDTTFPESEL